ncbi:MAG: hypothetical protein Q9167_003482 [Letrouitia subvulpina]
MFNRFRSQKDSSSEDIPLRGQDSSFSTSNKHKVSNRIDLQSELLHRYSANHQSLRLFGKQFLRWVPTAVLALAIIGTFKSYENKGNMTSADKATFNVIILVLSLLLGLNFFEAFKEAARILRWRILAYKHWNSQDRNTILAIENLTSVIKLGLTSFKNHAILIFCLSWIILFLLAQASIALINLTYELNDGTDWNGTYTRDGHVHVPNLTCYFHSNACPNEDFKEEITQGQAHSNGNVGSNVKCGAYDTISDILQSRQNPDFFCRRVPGEFAYRFSEYNPSDNQSTYPHFTNRIITASSGACLVYNETGNQSGTDANGFPGAVYYTFSNGTYNDSISIPFASGGLKATTYIYRGINPPERATAQSCGPRCIWLWAYRSPGTKQSPLFYQCPISIGTVSNVTDVRQDVPDGIARTAAAAIALQGRWSNGTGHMSWEQMQFYPFGNEYEIHFQSVKRVGSNMARFAMLSLATLAKTNPRILIPGTVPYLGTRIHVLWPYAISLLAAITGVHFVLFASVVYVVRDVNVIDDSNSYIERLQQQPLVAVERPTERVEQETFDRQSLGAHSSSH